MSILFLFYTLGVRAYVLAIRIASCFHPKARLWKNGRRHLFERLENLMKNENRPVIWVHCASYGEFEQGRPLIEKIFLNHPDRFLIVTFFSPSGKEAFSKFPMVHHVEYLPADVPSKVRRFLDILKPEKAIFIRYEFWLNYLKELDQRDIPHYLVSAVFKPHHPFFRWYGSIFRESLKGFKEIFVQDSASARLLATIGIHHASVQGDTRVDRVMAIRNDKSEIAKISLWNRDGVTLVAGSIWEEDWNWLLQWWGTWKKKTNGLRAVLVPHEVDSNTIQKLTHAIASNGFSYVIIGSEPNSEDFIVVDKIGMLSRLYAFADIAYVGGAMGKGLHNILEPAVFEIPILVCGNNFSNFVEADELKSNGALWQVLPHEVATDIISQSLQKKDKIAEILKNYFSDKAGATQKMYEKIFKN